jgi:DNA-binding IclR family transcriptional regulator
MFVEDTGKHMISGETRPKTRESGVDRAVEILECLHEAGEPLVVAEIARRINAPKSTVYNIANRFMKADILEAYEPRGRIFFGKAMHFYGTDYIKQNDLMRRAREEVDHLAKETSETIEFCTLQGNKYTIAYMQSGARMFRISSEIGVKLPIPWTASGRLFLAGKSQEDIIGLIPPEDFTLPDGRHIVVANFLQEIHAAEEAGYCVTSGLIDSLTQCLAAPIRDRAGKTIATLCAVVMIDRPQIDVMSIVKRLMETATRLSLVSGARATSPR